jgi:hypothetical protein
LLHLEDAEAGDADLVALLEVLDREFDEVARELAFMPFLDISCFSASSAAIFDSATVRTLSFSSAM